MRDKRENEREQPTMFQQMDPLASWTMSSQRNHRRNRPGNSKSQRLEWARLAVYGMAVLTCTISTFYSTKVLISTENHDTAMLVLHIQNGVNGTPTNQTVESEPRSSHATPDSSLPEQQKHNQDDQRAATLTPATVVEATNHSDVVYPIRQKHHKRDDPHHPAIPELFLDRLNRLLPPCQPSSSNNNTNHSNNVSTGIPCDADQPRLFAKDVQRLEEEIANFNIPKRIVIDFDPKNDYVSIPHWRFVNLLNGLAQDGVTRVPKQCPNCVIRHTSRNAGMNATTLEERQKEPAHVLFTEGKCYVPNPDRLREYPDQVTMVGCGESQYGTGWGFAKTRHRFDYHSSFEDTGGPFQRTFAHWHLSPPMAGFGSIRSVAEFAQHLLLQPAAPVPREKRSSTQPVMFTHNNCRGKRGELVREMIRTSSLNITRYGKCFHNHEGLGGNCSTAPTLLYGDCEATRDGTKTFLSSRHAFTFSMENTQSPDYFTEKRFQALLAGSVPIVWDNDNSVDFLPDADAALLVNAEQDTAQTVAQRIQDAASNQTQLDAFFAWKKRGLRPDFVRKLFLTTDYLVCRICEYMAHHEF